MHEYGYLFGFLSGFVVGVWVAFETRREGSILGHHKGDEG